MWRVTDDSLAIAFAMILLYGLSALSERISMAFVRMKGIEGLMYVPEENGGVKKHPCKDCYACQMCSDNRCALCRREVNCNKSQTEK